LIVGLLCFVVRLFSNSCLAYAYLRKWRYLLDLIEEYWKSNTPSLDSVNQAIDKYHHARRTTDRKAYFARSQLLAGFLLLFLFSFFLLLFEICSNLQQLGNLFLPISFLAAYYAYEAIVFFRHEALGRPEADDQTSEEPRKSEIRNRNDRSTERDLDVIQEILVSVIGATVFSYFLGESLTLFHEKYTNIIYRWTWPQFLSGFAEAYGPPALFALIDVTLFILLFYKIYWKHIEERKERLDGSWWFFAQMFRLFPASTVPWPFQHIFTAWKIEPARWLEHVMYLPIWAVVSFGLVGLAIIIEKWRSKKSSYRSID